MVCAMTDTAALVTETEQNIRAQLAQLLSRYDGALPPSVFSTIGGCSSSTSKRTSPERYLVQCTPIFIGSSKNYKSRQLKSSLQLITGAIPEKIGRLVPSYHHRTHDFHHYFGSLLIPHKLLFG